MSIINTKTDIDFTKQPLFFGEGLNLQRYDVFKHKPFFDNFITQLSCFWRPEVVSVVRDCSDFEGLSEVEKEIFTNNLKYQILLDSVASRSIPYISQCTSLPEIEAACSSWQLFETIHSYAYTYVIKNVYSKGSDVFDNILNDEAIMTRASSVTRYYDDLIEALSDDDPYQKKKKLYLTLISVNILEGIRFYVSFACSYAFAETGRMEGNAKIIKQINRDESIHLALSQRMIRLLRTDESEGFSDVVEECEDMVKDMYRIAAEEEIAWSKHLFRKGSIMGLNEDILTEYMKYLTYSRMSAIGVQPIFAKRKNPISWIKAWTGEDVEVQTAPQETELSDYRVDNVLSDGDTVDYNAIL